MGDKYPHQLLAQQLSQSQPLLRALADRARQDILALLLKHQHLSVGELTGYTRLSRPAVSHHLRVLRDANLLASTREGVRLYYRLTLLGASRDLADLSASLGQVGDQN